jgi:hypothetical protein
MMRDYKSQSSNLNFSRRRKPNRGLRMGGVLLMVAAIGFGIFYLVASETPSSPTGVRSEDDDTPPSKHSPKRIPLDLPPPAQPSPQQQRVPPGTS